MRIACGLDVPRRYPHEWRILRDQADDSCPGHSPLQLAQEMVGGDGEVRGWRIVVASMMHVQTARSVAHPTLWRLLSRWDHPAALAFASGPELVELLRPCGLQNRRARQLIVMSKQYMVGYRPWPHDPDVRMEGVGRYIEDAYRVFELGDLYCSPMDHELAAYVRWALLIKRRMDAIGPEVRVQVGRLSGTLSGRTSWKDG